MWAAGLAGRRCRLAAEAARSAADALARSGGALHAAAAALASARRRQNACGGVGGALEAAADGGQPGREPADDGGRADEAGETAEGAPMIHCQVLQQLPNARAGYALSKNILL
jgi:hypothetical protein